MCECKFAQRTKKKKRKKSPDENPQLNKNGELQHLLGIDGLPKSIIKHILDTASSFVDIGERELKKCADAWQSVFNLFFENSTRTRTTFEIAAKRLSADDQPQYRCLIGPVGRVLTRHD